LERETLICGTLWNEGIMKIGIKLLADEILSTLLTEHSFLPIPILISIQV